jgi:hypothetical protein
MKTGHEGGYLLPNSYVDRSAIDLALERGGKAEADAAQALATLHPDENSGDSSSKLGCLYLAQARALAAQGKSAQARAAARRALEHFQRSLGPDHPDTQSARRLAQ